MDAYTSANLIDASKIKDHRSRDKIFSLNWVLFVLLTGLSVFTRNEWDSDNGLVATLFIIASFLQCLRWTNWQNPKLDLFNSLFAIILLSIVATTKQSLKFFHFDVNNICHSTITILAILAVLVNIVLVWHLLRQMGLFPIDLKRHLTGCSNLAPNKLLKTLQWIAPTALMCLSVCSTFFAYVSFFYWIVYSQRVRLSKNSDETQISPREYRSQAIQDLLYSIFDFSFFAVLIARSDFRLDTFPKILNLIGLFISVLSFCLLFSLKHRFTALFDQVPQISIKLSVNVSQRRDSILQRAENSSKK